MSEQGKIRIYVACLAAYNNAVLHGRWIDAEQDAPAIQQEVSAMLRTSPIEDAEEWAIHDHEGFKGISISEWESFESVSELATFIAEHGNLGADLVSYFGELEEAKKALEERYAGEHRSVSDFVQKMTEQNIEVPEGLQYFIDWEAMAQEWEINDILAIETDFEAVHVFWRA